MAQGRVSKVLLLVGLAWMVFAEYQIAFQQVETGGHLGYAVQNNRAYRTYVDTPGTVTSPELDGWNAHPVAGIVLIALAALFILNINLGPTWLRFRYWIALASLIACLLPSPGQTLILAVPTFILAFIAALLDRSAKPVASESAK
jgi:hypothetical protein